MRARGCARISVGAREKQWRVDVVQLRVHVVLFSMHVYPCKSWVQAHQQNVFSYYRMCSLR